MRLTVRRILHEIPDGETLKRLRRTLASSVRGAPGSWRRANRRSADAPLWLEKDEMSGWILIFDEDVYARLPITHVFAQRGFVVLEAAKVADVFECAERLDLACVFLAIDAPEGDGIAVLSLLRESHPDLPVAVVADHFTEQLAREARRHGARCCLERPISSAVIERCVTELCFAHDHAAV